MKKLIYVLLVLLLGCSKEQIKDIKDIVTKPNDNPVIELSNIKINRNSIVVKLSIKDNGNTIQSKKILYGKDSTNLSSSVPVVADSGVISNLSTGKYYTKGAITSNNITTFSAVKAMSIASVDTTTVPIDTSNKVKPPLLQISVKSLTILNNTDSLISCKLTTIAKNVGTQIIKRGISIYNGNNLVKSYESNIDSLNLIADQLNELTTYTIKGYIGDSTKTIIVTTPRRLVNITSLLLDQVWVYDSQDPTPNKWAIRATLSFNKYTSPTVLGFGICWSKNQNPKIMKAQGNWRGNYTGPVVKVSSGTSSLTLAPSTLSPYTEYKPVILGETVYIRTYIATTTDTIYSSNYTYKFH